MTNIFFELDRLKYSFENRGIDALTVDMIVQKASEDIRRAMDEQGEAAMQLAIEDMKMPDEQVINPSLWPKL